jgi:predicted Zn finger-like uncharacterized protein
MDIRCERCFTEYELEDESVSEAGTSVQCTSCSYTFTVRRPPRAELQAVITPTPVATPTSADWLLETEKGQVHRLRELSALHQWIVERKVTRLDRISRTGQSWKRLEEIVELKPFFDVVEEADQAKEAVALAQKAGLSAAAPLPQPPPAAAAPPPPRAPPQPAPPQPAPPPPAPTAPTRTGLHQQARTARAAAGPQRPITRSVAVVNGRSARRTPEVDTWVVRKRGFGKLLVTLAVAGAVAYLGINHLRATEGQPLARLALPNALQWARIGSTQAPVVTAGTPAAAAAVEAAAPAAPTEERPMVAKATAMRAAASKTASTEAAPSRPASTAAPADDTPPGAAPTRPERESARATKPTAAPAERPYGDIVKEARRLQENGAITRARKLYETALAMQPDGVEALAGMGYVQLDRNKFSSAIAYFRKALSIGQHPPALFGMGEAYRYAGDPKNALDAYRRFLTIAPGDRDAPIARRQIKALSSATSSRPPGGDVPSASSILQEGAR